jgi:ubiquinol oxidase
MLHLYETLGWWRAGAEVRRVHFAEVLNASHGIIMLIINN